MRKYLNCLCGLGLLFPASLVAQTHGESLAGLQFNFGLPGARSLGMGGAFLGRADDATAAQQNPAGLINLSQSEVAVEFKRFDYSNIFTDRGYVGPTTASFPPAGYPREFQFGEDDQEISSLSYASYVLAKPKWAWAIYRHQLVDFEAEFETFGASTGLSLPNGQIAAVRLFPIETATDVDVESYGTSVAFRLGSSFSIGLGVALHQYEAAGFTNRFDFPNSVEGPPTDILVATETVGGDDDDVTFNLGFQWKAGERVGTCQPG